MTNFAVSEEKNRWLRERMAAVGLREEDSTLVVASAPTIGSPLYEAGVERNDRLVALGGRPLITSADLDAVHAIAEILKRLNGCGVHIVERGPATPRLELRLGGE